MTFGEIKSTVFDRLRESADSPVFWSETDVAQAINDGYAELADACEFHEKHQNIPLMPDRPYYDMRRIAREGFLVCGPAYNLTTGRWLEPTSHFQLEPKWELRQGEPDRFIVRGLWLVGYWPINGAQGSPTTIKQYYVGSPDSMQFDEDEPQFHTSFHYGLVEYALFDLFAQDGEVDLAWAAWKEYLRYEMGLKASTAGRLNIPRVRRMGRSIGGGDGTTGL